MDYWRQHYGPTLKAFEAVGPAGQDALEADLVALIGRFNRADDGTMVVPNEYLEAVIIRPLTAPGGVEFDDRTSPRVDDVVETAPQDQDEERRAEEPEPSGAAIP